MICELHHYRITYIITVHIVIMDLFSKCYVSFNLLSGAQADAGMFFFLHFFPITARQTK